MCFSYRHKLDASIRFGFFINESVTQIRSEDMKQLIMVVSAMLFALAPAGEAFAFGPGGPGGPGMHRGHKGKKGCLKGYAVKCVKKLFHMPAPVLKERLGLDDNQVKKISDFRDNCMMKKVTYKAEIGKLKCVV